MQELLLGTWGPRIVAYSEQYPWTVLTAVLLLDLMFRKNRGSTGADISGWDFGDGDGGCGD
jgi:hypothetical protein